MIENDYGYEEYKERFEKMSYEELVETFNHEVGNPAIIQRRIIYLGLLCDQLRNKGYKGDLSLKNKISKI